MKTCTEVVGALHKKWLCLVLVALAPLTGGCAYSVFSPPARSLPLEGSAVLPPGKTGITVQAAAHGEVFGPGVVGGTVQIRRGVLSNMEASAEGGFLTVDGNSVAGTSPDILMMRGGMRVNPGGIKHVALAGGVGGGYSAAGFYFSPDLGAVLAFENCYFVPLIAARAWVSIPIANRAVDISGQDQSPGTNVFTPLATRGLMGMAGFRIPLGLHQCDQHPVAPAALMLGFSRSHLQSAQFDGDFVGVGMGFEGTF